MQSKRSVFKFFSFISALDVLRSATVPLLELTKPGIVFLVIICGVAGYGLGYETGHQFRLFDLFQFVVGLAFLSGGSLALNQVQEWRTDQEMPRTSKRPIPSGNVSPSAALVFSVACLFTGFTLLFTLRGSAGWLGLISVILYNGFYTLTWKRRWVFAAVPGALPGAMPVAMGFAASSESIFRLECLYVFLIMFLWQMPHFWSLAIRYKDDYRRGGFPVMPARLGTHRALFHIGIYTLVYAAFALSAPWFVTAGYLYLFLVVPLAIKVLWEFMRFYQSGGEKRWLPFFLWTNFSLLGFLVAPVVDKWVEYFSASYFN